MHRKAQHLRPTHQQPNGTNILPFNTPETLWHTTRSPHPHHRALAPERPGGGQHQNTPTHQQVSMGAGMVRPINTRSRNYHGVGQGPQSHSGFRGRSGLRPVAAHVGQERAIRGTRDAQTSLAAQPLPNHPSLETARGRGMGHHTMAENRRQHRDRLQRAGQRHTPHPQTGCRDPSIHPQHHRNSHQQLQLPPTTTTRTHRRRLRHCPGHMRTGPPLTT